MTQAIAGIAQETVVEELATAAASSSPIAEDEEAAAALAPARLTVLRAPKEGNTEGQYEDACAYSSLEGNPAQITVCLADGASSAVFAREWAETLVQAFAATGFPADDTGAARTLTALGRQWRAEAEKKATAWWAQEKLPYGSAATLLCVTWDREGRTWNAAAVGDCCVFLVRGNKLRFAFPLTRSARFSDRPPLLTTEIGGRDPLPAITRYLESYEEGDRFLLMTDALSQYFLSEFESKRRPWNHLPDSPEMLAGWLKARRDDGSLKNDDITLVDLAL